MPTRIVIACTFAIAATVSTGARAQRPSPAQKTSSSHSSAAVQTWTLSTRPTVQIGAVDGPDAQLLHHAVSAVRLADGRVAVLNAGSHELRIFDSSGRHLHTAGAKGDGPGEFRTPVRVYSTPDDSLLVYDAGRRQELRFDADGRFIWMAEPDVPEGERQSRDVWTYGRALVDGPMRPADRPAVRATLDRLPPAEAADGFRFVRIDGQNRAWVRGEPWAAVQPTRWMIFEPNGAPLATLETPAGFELFDSGDDFVVGRVRDDLGVEYVRVYAVHGAASGASSAAPPPPRTAVPALPPADATLLARLKSALRQAQVQQELFYSNPRHGYRYAGNPKQLEWSEKGMDGITVRILDASERGYTILLFHESAATVCSLSIGAGAPVGWTQGIIVCR